MEKWKEQECRDRMERNTKANSKMIGLMEEEYKNTKMVQHTKESSKMAKEMEEEF